METGTGMKARGSRRQSDIRRTAWVLLSIVLAFFFGIMLKYLLLAK